MIELTEFCLCNICKYINEECDGEHCGHCGRYDYDKFKLDYVTQITKDFRCSKSLAKKMYHAMLMTYKGGVTHANDSRRQENV